MLDAPAAIARVEASAQLDLRAAHPHRLADPRARAVPARDRGDRVARRLRHVQPRRRARRRVHRRRRSRRGSATTSRRRSTPANRAFGPGKRLLEEPGRALVANSTVTLYTVQSVKRNVSTWVAVDGGMSDNLRPMLYGAVYEAQVADRFGGGTPSRLTGKHCESGDVIVARRRARRPARRRRRRDPRDRRVRPRDGQQLQRRPAPAGRLRLRRRCPRRRAPRDATTTSPPAMSTERPRSRSASACSATARSAARSRRCSASAPTTSPRSPGCGPRSPAS